MNQRNIDHPRRRVIKLAAYATITLPVVGIPVAAIGAEDVSLVSNDEPSATISRNSSKEVSRGHVIEIVTPQASASEAPSESNAGATGEEVLLIDGGPVPYTKNSQGYHIYYQPPEDSLLKAARSFVETQREK